MTIQSFIRTSVTLKWTNAKHWVSMIIMHIEKNIYEIWKKLIKLGYFRRN